MYLMSKILLADNDVMVFVLLIKMYRASSNDETYGRTAVSKFEINICSIFAFEYRQI